jgi:hypothetical protein
MDRVRLIFTDDDVWIYPAGDGDIHYTTLVGANLDVESLTVSAARAEEIREQLAKEAPEITWHDMRKAEEKPAEEVTVVVYDDPDEYLGDVLSPQWPPPD